MTRNPDILGLFPGFESPLFGGVQASGREAWEGITAQGGLSAEAFFYESNSPKLPTVLRAAGRRCRPGTLLVWHSGLLKLAPFISSGGRRVLFLHGIEVWRRQDALTTRLMAGTDLFLSNSEHTWRRFLTFHAELTGKPHVTVPLGLGHACAGPVPVPEGPPAALMIGRMQREENYKGHREMIAIWPRVLAAMPAAELWIVGGGDLQPELQGLVRAGNLENHVRFFGAIPEQQKQDLLRRCRVMALPSAGEGFGLVYLEAMRLGRPCIVSMLDAGSEVVHPPEAGLAVDLPDHDGTADAVLRLLAGGADWESFSLRAKRRYDENFTGRHFQARLLAALLPLS